MLSPSNPIPVYAQSDFAALHKAGALAAAILDRITPFVVPGVTTGQLDERIHRDILESRAIPATIGYRGYTKATCISVNHVVCHGIPGEKALVEGDIVNIDVTVIVDGWYGDTSRMYLVGEKIPAKSRKLVEVTYDAMMAGIEAVKPGATLGDIGHAIQNYAEGNRFSVVRDFCGHGIGRVFHSGQILHYGRPGTGTVLEQGMVFTIEPMINAGTWQVKVLNDGWTAVTRDRQPSAQFEHMVGVTETGVEIFTLSPAGYTKPPYSL
ncbi:MAG: map [Alphaproteobacteria bacterium]|nr:map [Alphaproteobacteria bacterium]